MLKKFFKSGSRIGNMIDMLREAHSVTMHHISTGTVNGLVMVTIASLAAYGIVTNVTQYNIEVAAKQVEAAKIALLVAETDVELKKSLTKINNAHDLEKERIKNATMIEVAKLNAMATEAKAAANPYVALAKHNPSHVSVFIDTENDQYIIETSDGATEVAISTINIKGRKYTPEQKKLMTMAFHIGKEVGYPETIQSLLLQETRAGAFGDRIGDTNLPIGKRSYGVMQMKVATAKKVMRKYPSLITTYFPGKKNLKSLRDEEIIIKLIQDDEFNIRSAALNFVIHRKASKTWAQAVVAYNTGQGKANTITEPKKHHYYKGVLVKLIKEVRPFNKEVKLST